MNLLIKDLNDRIIIKDKDVSNVNILISKKNFTGFSKKVFFINQVHSDKIILLNNKKMLQEKFQGDAIISNIKYPIGIKTADCLPIFIYSDCGNVVSVVHAGWRGTALKILEKTINTIKNKLQINKKYLNFILGVAICKNCYEIKQDMFIEFIKNYGKDGEKFFSKNIDRFDLIGANIAILHNNGIKENKIFNLHKCSCCNNDFFSYRRGDEKERILNIIT